VNDAELRKKVHSAMYALIKSKGVASPVEVLLEIGVLSKEKYEDWRFGRVSYLERVCQINLSKLSTINHEIRVFARKNNLKASWSDYRKWGKGNNIRLRFSKSGGEQIERLYATHYVSQQKVKDAQDRHTFQKRKDELARTIAPCGLVCGLCGEAPACKGCRDNDNCCARADVCYQRKCCAEKGIKGCWKCADFPCGNDMFSPERDVRLRAFVRCAKEDGVKGLAGHILRNQDNGLLYHKDKQNHTGDYDDLGSEEAVLELLRAGKSKTTETS
jgi:hypothetical protein